MVEDELQLDIAVTYNPDEQRGAVQATFPGDDSGDRHPFFENVADAVMRAVTAEFGMQGMHRIAGGEVDVDANAVGCGFGTDEDIPR